MTPSCRRAKKFVVLAKGEQMEKPVAEVCEDLYQLAKREGKRTTSPEDSSRQVGEGGDVGYGSRNSRTHYTLPVGLVSFIVKATEENWVLWDPSKDSRGVFYKLEIFNGEELVFSAHRAGPSHIERFNSRDELFLGREDVEARPWECSQMNFPTLILEDPRLS